MGETEGLLPMLWPFILSWDVAFDVLNGSLVILHQQRMVLTFPDTIMVLLDSHRCAPENERAKREREQNSLSHLQAASDRGRERERRDRWLWTILQIGAAPKMRE